MPKLPSTCQKGCSRRHAKQNCLRQHAKRVSVDVRKWWCPSTCQEFVSVDMPKHRPIVSQSLDLKTSATCLALVLRVFFIIFTSPLWNFIGIISDNIWQFTGQCLACDSKFCSLVTPMSSRLWLPNHHHHRHRHRHHHHHHLHHLHLHHPHHHQSQSQKKIW